MNQTYLENKNLIWKLCINFHKRNPDMDFDELLSEAHLIFCESIQKFDPTKSKVSTYLWNQLSFLLQNFIQRERKHYARQVHTDVLPIVLTQSDLLPFDMQLSPEGEAALYVIFNEGLEEIPMPITKNGIKTFLRKKGWKYTDIKNAFNEIERSL